MLRVYILDMYVRVILLLRDMQKYNILELNEKLLPELQSISPVFKEDIYEAVSMDTCVNKRLTLGAPGKAAMEQVISLHEKWMEEHP